MRIQTPVNRDNVRTHFTYSGWKYLLLVCAALLIWMIFDMTRPQVGESERIDVYVQSNIANAEVIDAFLKPIWDSAAPDMKLVDSVALTVGDEYTTNMQLSTYVFVGEGDIYFLTETYYKSLAAGGGLLQLDELVADGSIRTDGKTDLQKGYVTVVTETDDQGNAAATEQHLYGIPLDTYYGFMSGMQIDNRGMYACILVANKNDENVIPFFSALLEAGEGEKPDWITE